MRSFHENEETYKSSLFLFPSIFPSFCFCFVYLLACCIVERYSNATEKTWSVGHHIYVSMIKNIN